MAYTPPRLEIQQDFQAVPAFTNAPLAALIVGPQYSLTRYTQEKAYAAVVNPDTVSSNSYIPASDVAYPYPSKLVNTIVDTAYTQVYFDGAAAKYFPLTALGTFTPGTTDSVAAVGSYTNRVRSTAVIFKTGNGTARSTRFSGRDVQIGDTAILNNGSVTTTTKVTGFVAEVVAATLSAVTQAATNKATTTESFNGAITGTYANVTSANSSTAYKGYTALGITADTYTATVTTSGNLTTALFSIASASNAFSTLTNVALASNVLNIDTNGSNVVRINFTGSTAFVAGQTFVISVVAPVTRVTPTVSGTFTGTNNITYTGTIVRGGLAYDGSTNGATCAQIYFTSTGTDSYGPVNLQLSTAITSSNFGTTMTIASATSSGGFVLGDAYVFTATAATSGAFQTLIVKDDLPTGPYTLVLAETKNDLLIPQLRSTSGAANWISNSDTITVKSGIYINNPALIGTDFTLAQLPIVSAKVYVQHRDLLRTKTSGISLITDITTVASVLGAITPDNPLAQGVYHALLNSNSTSVYYVGVNTNDLAGYTTALGYAGKTNKIYGIVPLTKNVEITTLVQSHVNTYSTSVQAKWRTCWLSADLVPTAALYLSNNGSDYLATVSDDPQASGTQYSVFGVVGATFVTSGVRIGDVIRYNFTTNAAGVIVYDSFTVAEIRSETSLVSATALAAAVTVAKKFELWRVYSQDEQAANYAATSGSNRRVRQVFPGTLTLGSTTYDSTIACAALAGLRSGVAPHESLTNIELLGFDGVATTLSFSEEQLNTIADAGIWILAQDIAGGSVYTRHQLTTDRSSTKTQEDQFTSNTDSISYGLQAVLMPFIGKYNITPESKVVIYDTIAGELRFRQTGTFTTRGGNQLLGFTIDKFEQNATFKDRLDINITVDEPYPFNNGKVTITV